MVKTIINLSEKYEPEPELRPEFIKEIEIVREKGKFVKVKDFAKEFRLKKQLICTDI